MPAERGAKLRSRGVLASNTPLVTGLDLGEGNWEILASTDILCIYWNGGAYIETLA